MFSSCKPLKLRAYTPCLRKNGHLFIFGITLSKLTDLTDFWYMKPWERLRQLLIDLPTSPVNCSHCTLGNPESHFSTMLFIHDSNYLRYLRTEWNATVTMQLNRNCLLTVTWTVGLGLPSRRVTDARAAACDTQHCWGRVCLWPRQCTSTSRSWHSRASALWDTPVHQSWHVASQQSWPGWLLHLGGDACACIPSTNQRYARVAAAACWDMG